MSAHAATSRRKDPADSAGQVEPDKKKRKVGAKKASAFEPQPVQLPNSSDTPPEDETINLPPPPSERKIARRRESTRAIRDRQPQSPSVSPPPKRAKAATTSQGETAERRDLLSLQPSSSSLPTSRLPQIQGLSFDVPNPKPRPSMPHLPSPPRTISQPSWGSRSVMGPPEGFVRKTRKSMASLQTEMMTDEIVTIPERETPMIRKNKELREAQSRRSSLGMRGQRASSSLGRGDLSIPHPSVSSSQFYTHISSTQPEPIRARHLLVYCADRAFKANIDPPPPKSKSRTRKSDGERTDEGDKLMRDIMTEFLSGLGMGSVDTNVFASGPSTSTVIPTRPNEKNVANRAAKDKEEAIIRRCKDECNEWARLRLDADRERRATADRMAKKAKAVVDPHMATADRWMQDALGLAENVIEAGEGDLTEMGEFPDVEYKVDTLHQSSHKALQFSQQATRFLDGIFSSLTTDLRTRGRFGEDPSTSRNTDDPPDLTSLVPPSSSTSTNKAPARDPIHMLRALASAEATQASEEAIAAAASVPPAHLGQSTSATPRRPGVTPRRGLGAGTTPRGPGTASKVRTPAGAE